MFYNRAYIMLLFTRFTEMQSKRSLAGSQFRAGATPQRHNLI